MGVQRVCFLAGEDVIGLILQRLRGTPDHRPQRRRRDLGRDGKLDGQGVHLVLGLRLGVRVTGGGLGHHSDQQQAQEGGQWCDKRDGAARKMEVRRKRKKRSEK